MTNWSIINGNLTTTTTAAGLAAAIAAARPGTIVQVTTAGAPLDLSLNAVQKAGYGVCVLLPMDQVIRAEFTGACSNLHFFGGTWSADQVVGVRANAHYGMNIRGGSSKISLHGGFVDGNSTGLLTQEACTDVLISKSYFNISRGDCMQAIGVTRLAFNDNVSGNGGTGAKFCYYNNGDEPDENISEYECETVRGGIFEDAAHSDGIQVRTGSSDFTCLRNDLNSFGAEGIVSFDNIDSIINRVLVANNVINNAEGTGVYLKGGDIEYRDNVLATNPSAVNQPGLTLERYLSGAMRGGRNTAPAGKTTNPSGVDLLSGSINGDTVVAPEMPRIILPPWAPTPSVPSAPAAAPPAYVDQNSGGVGGGIRAHGTITIGTWLSVNRGFFSGVQDATWEVRWKNNGVIIATTVVYQVQASDIGDSITVEVRGTNAAGVGDWATYPAVVPV